MRGWGRRRWWRWRWRGFRRRGISRRRICLDEFQQRTQTLGPQIALQRRVRRALQLRHDDTLPLLWPRLGLGFYTGFLRLRTGHDAGQCLWIVDLEELPALRVFAWRGRALFVRLMNRHMLVEDIERLLGGGELNGQHAFAVVNWLGGTLAQLRALAVRSAVLVEQRVVAVVGEAEAVVLAAVPAVVEAVAEAVDALNGVDTALCNGALLAHLLLGVGGWLQRLEDAQVDLVFHLLHVPAVVCAGGRGEVGQRQGNARVGHILVGVRLPAIVRGQAIGRLVAWRSTRVVRLWVRVGALGLVLRRVVLGRRGRGRGDPEGGVDPEGQLGLCVLGLFGRLIEVLPQ